tara:strand:+ start:1778 stop:2023 length:246 start_codon:yes stop_codon:yes gene_type:complete
MNLKRFKFSKLKLYLVHFLQAKFFLYLIIIPKDANACAVCFSGKEETLQAFYITTIFLTLLPILMLTILGIWLYRKYRKAA